MVGQDFWGVLHSIYSHNLYYTWARCGKFNISSFGVEFFVDGIIIFAVDWVFVVWSMVENKFFETTVHIQKERGAKSCFHWALCHCPASGLCRHDSIFWLRPVHHQLSLRADSDIANYFCSCFPHIL